MLTLPPYTMSMHHTTIYHLLTDIGAVHDSTRDTEEGVRGTKQTKLITYRAYSHIAYSTLRHVL